MAKADVVVVGGGPSGAYCALRLAEAGFSVVLLEAGPRGRYKPCAGGVSPKSLSLLPELPDELVETKVDVPKIFSRGGQLTMKLPDSYGVMVYRTGFDQWLRDLAASAGAQVLHETKARDIRITGDGVHVAYPGGSVEGRALVGAFGLNTRMFKILGLRPPKAVLAVQKELKLRPEVLEDIRGTLEIYMDSRLSRHGYAWIFPKSEGASVGILDVPRRGKGLMEKLSWFIREHPVASGKLEGAEEMYIGGVCLSVDLIPDEPLEEPFGDRFLLVGDAAGLADPMTWEGLSYALTSARLAAEVLVGALEEDRLEKTALARYSALLREELLEPEIWPGAKLADMVYDLKPDLFDAALDALLAMAHEDEELKAALRWMISKEKPHRDVLRVISGKRFRLIRRLGFVKALRLLLAGKER